METEDLFDKALTHDLNAMVVLILLTCFLYLTNRENRIVGEIL